MFNFLHTFQPNPILFSAGPIKLYWYGFLMVLAMATAIFYLYLLSIRNHWPKNLVADIAFELIIGGLIGARIYHCLVQWPYYSQNILEIFQIWRGGLAIHGAVLGGAIVLWFFAYRRKFSFILLAGTIACVLPLAQSIGRFGNYFNQELFGQPTTLAWGIPIEPAQRPVLYADYDFFQPTFLYESALNFLLFLIMFFLASKYAKGGNKKGAKILLATYFLGYSIIRFLMEFLRIDPTPEILGLRWPQVVSLLIISLAIYLFLQAKKEDGLTK